LLRHLIFFTSTISHPRHGQVSGHDFSALPDTSVASEGCVVVPKRAQERFLPCAAGGRAAQRSDNSFQQFRPANWLKRGSKNIIGRSYPVTSSAVTCFEAQGRAPFPFSLIIQSSAISQSFPDQCHPCKSVVSSCLSDPPITRDHPMSRSANSPIPSAHFLWYSHRFFAGM